ncbi:cyclic nucleotide-binding domain-containing protein [Actinocorallia populi]|uniref:cyclic nucleotide-binding domain-containing protein n=1 Tax=Actinocorallia populi TaxID=2079200 RepID=UPI0013001700|nr:cyclic nucleotide-binding domain-containing protein [Actinocorallia populi]
MYLATVLVGAGFGGVYGSLAGGFVGIFAIPLIGFTRGLMSLMDQARPLMKEPEDAARLMQQFAGAYLGLFALLIPYRPRRPAAVEELPEMRKQPEWPEKDTKAIGDGRERGSAPEGHGDFWSRLTLEEQDDLTRRGRTVHFADGASICRQGERGDRVYVLRSGRVEIRHDDGSGPRTVAERGTGDLVGERAAFELRERSATMVAIGPVDALVVETPAFTEFVERHPAVLEKVERGLYERLTERRPAAPFRYAGQTCTILMTDICSFNDPGRTDVDRLVVREVMYGALRRSLEGSGVPWDGCHREDRGDGALVIVPPALPTHAVLHPMAELLAEEIAAHGRRASPGERLVLRLAVGAGPVVQDGQGMVGESINGTARLLDAPAFKARMRGGVGVAVSPFVHENFVRHLPFREEYEQVEVKVKETSTTGWVRLL